MKIIGAKWFKYVIVLLIFGIWIFFFDDYSWSEQRKLNAQLKELRKELQETEKQIKEYELKNNTIENDLKIKEAIGRENYFMKRDDEDVYIFVTEDEETGELVLFE
ncbi:MAG: septum formation initiator family protein [Bacteroidales bacterium]|jgi:cell division protein FtsB|nr:septum formation initiator family protein [Bacteroidales bacterium]